MGLTNIWKQYKVLIVMGTSLGLIHWGWYTLKSHPLLRRGEEGYIPEPGMVSYAAPDLPSKTK